MEQRQEKKGYDPHKIEEKWYKVWEEKGYFRSQDTSEKPAYCIVIPPPNVTGSLHMGHALNNTLQDILIRYYRMRGYNTLWMPGTDHAGIATQNVVEKELDKEGLSRHDLGRERFVERVWEWKKKYGDHIILQLKKLGASCDWERERFTLDEGLSRAVREVFVRLYEEGLIYRDEYLINWCPRCETALSDLEVEHDEVTGHLWYIRYPLAEGQGHLTVATTRPETMFGDTAVAVNPSDERYRDMVGKMVHLPLTDKKIPVIADDYVELEFGTGALKITPAHDPNDFEIGNRHGLERVKVIDETGRMNENAGKFSGMDRFEARKAAVEQLEAEGLLEKIEDYASSVGHCYRCKQIVEPNLSLQWFVKVRSLAEEATRAVKEGRTRIVPANWTKTYYHWMENIRDWCISRQLWWGHRIPAWFCGDCGEIIVAREDPSRCTCGSENLRQETDVLDTWFSSALWPFSTLGWPEKTPLLETFYPTSCLVTGFDILFFWVARMMMMGCKFMGDVPFNDVYIHALVRDAEGRKMSKSKGNVIDPLEIIDQYGADAFRFTLASMAAQGRDVSLSEKRIMGYRKFGNKIFNAVRFSLMNLEDYEPLSLEQAVEHASLADRWILSRLQATAAEVASAIEEYRFNEAAHAIYQFIWHELCDWYIEMVKPVLYSEDRPRERRAAQAVLRTALDASLRLLHPFMPFVSEELWQKLPDTRETIMLADFAPVSDSYSDQAAEREMELIISVITAIRNIRGEMNIAPSTPIPAYLGAGNPERKATLEAARKNFELLAKVGDLQITVKAERQKKAAVEVVNGVEIAVPLEGLVDLDAEKARLEKSLGKLEKELAKLQGKLSNEEFVSNAPEWVVDKQREQEAEAREKRDKLNRNLERICSLMAETG